MLLLVEKHPPCIRLLTKTQRADPRFEKLFLSAVEKLPNTIRHYPRDVQEMYPELVKIAVIKQPDTIQFVHRRARQG